MAVAKSGSETGPAVPKARSKDPESVEPQMMLSVVFFVSSGKVVNCRSLLWLWRTFQAMDAPDRRLVAVRGGLPVTIASMEIVPSRPLPPRPQTLQ